MNRIMMTLGLLLLVLKPAQADEFNGTKFIKISTAEQAAVIKKPDGKLQLLHIGDTVDKEIHIIAIKDDRIILEGPGEWGPVKYIVEVAAGLMHITRMERRPLQKQNF